MSRRPSDSFLGEPWSGARRKGELETSDDTTEESTGPEEATPSSPERSRRSTGPLRPPAWLVTGHGHAREQYPFVAPGITLGRSKGCSVTVGGRGTSRLHAVIVWTGSSYEIRDRDSTNGVSVNGERVQVGTLAHGDVIDAGGHTFEWVSPRSQDESESG